ncbi:MAG: cadherin-like domain-containing protein, partial [Anaerolineales bacterium]|nr:cadherin-like domain-containing protein [Anaerolineales bacterium]
MRKQTKRTIYKMTGGLLLLVLAAGTLVGSGVAVPNLTATLTANLVVDNDSDNQADPGDTLEYQVVIANTGTLASDVQFAPTIDANTALVDLAGSDFRSTPIARDDSYQALGNVSINVPAASGLLANDEDPDGSGALVIASVPANSTNGGTIDAVDLNTGAFTYHPPAGYVGTDTFTYQVEDVDGNLDPATVTITIANMVWFIDNSAALAGDGRLNAPFNSIAAFNAIQTGSAPGAKDGDFIFLYTGSGAYADGIQLRNNQRLIGQGVSLDYELSLASISVPADSATLPGMGTRPSLAPGTGNAVRLAANNRLAGFDIGNTPGGSAIVDNGSVGSLAIEKMLISGTGGGISIVNGGTLNIALDALSASSSTDEGLHLVNVSGSFSMMAGTGTIATNGVPAVIIDGAPLALSLTFQSISASNTTSGIQVQDTTGYFTVNGSGSTDGSGGSFSNLTQRAASFINAAGVTLKNQTYTNASTTNGGSCDSLVNTGCHAAIHLQNTTGVNLTNVDITNVAQQGINGYAVANFTLADSTVTQCGDAVNEGCLRLVNLGGNSAITNSDLSFAAERVAQIDNLDTNLTLTVTGSTFRDTQSSGLGADGLEITFDGSSNATIDVANSNFLRNRTNGLQVFSEGAALVNLDVTGSTFDRGTGIGIGMDLAANNSASLNFNVTGNPKIYSNGGSAVNIFADVSANVQGRINNNPDIRAGGVGTSGFGISAVANGNSTVVVLIDNNGISNIGWDGGIRVLSRLDTDGNPSGRLDAVISNNTVTMADPVGLYDIWVQANDSNTTCANVTNNTASGAATAAFRVRESGSGTVLLQGFTTDAATTWSTNGNSGSPVSESGTASVGTCNTVSHPVAALARLQPVVQLTPADALLTASLNERSGQPIAKSTDLVSPIAAKVLGRMVALVPGLSVNLGTLDPNQQVTITYQVMINNPFPAGTTQVCGQANVSASGGISVDSDQVCTPIDAAPDLTISKSDGGVTAEPTDVVAYTLTYQNIGNQHASGVILTETVPANSSFTAGASNSGWVCTPDASAGSSCTFALGSLAAGGASGSVTFAVTAADPFPVGVTEISNTASLADDGTGGLDPNTANNTATDTTPVDAIEQLEISFTSYGYADGWVLERAETYDTGYQVDNKTKLLRVGDDRADRQYKVVLDFDTSGIPTGATVVGAALEFQQYSTVGTPFDGSLGALQVELKDGFFFNSWRLERQDFEAPA